MSGHVKQLVEAWGTFNFTDERQVTLEGFSGEHPIVRVAWS